MHPGERKPAARGVPRRSPDGRRCARDALKTSNTEESFFSDHTYQPGYFSYEEDGFGPVVSTEEGVLEWVRIFIDRQGVMDEEYQARINSVFSNRDGKCCSRIYEAILSSGSQYLAWRNGRYG